MFECCCSGDIPAGVHDLSQGNDCAAAWNAKRLDDSTAEWLMSIISILSFPNNASIASSVRIAPSVTWSSARIAPVRRSSRNRSPSSFFSMVSSSSYGKRSSPKPEREVRATTEAMLPGGAARRRRFRARRWMICRNTPMMPVAASIKARRCAGSPLRIEFLFRKGLCAKETETYSTCSRGTRETTSAGRVVFWLTK